MEDKSSKKNRLITLNLWKAFKKYVYEEIYFSKNI